MSRFSGKQGKGAMTKYRARKRDEAQAKRVERDPLLAPPPPPYVVAKVNGRYEHRPSTRGDAQSDPALALVNELVVILQGDEPVTSGVTGNEKIVAVRGYLSH